MGYRDIRKCAQLYSGNINRNRIQLAYFASFGNVASGKKDKIPKRYSVRIA
jgi:hypothetical protein